MNILVVLVGEIFHPAYLVILKERDRICSEFSVEICSTKACSEVPGDHSVNVDHWDYFEDDCIAKFFGCRGA